MRMYLGLVVPLVLALDQLTKHWAVGTLKLQGGSAPLWPGLVGFFYAENRGAAFSSLEGQQLLLVMLPLVLAVALPAYIWRHRELSWGASLGLWMIVAGGLGNCIDRIARGFVVDFVRLEFMRFGIFNVADISISLGAALVVIALWRERPKKGGDAGAVDN